MEAHNRFNSFFPRFMQIGELAGLAIGSTILLNVLFAGYIYTLLIYYILLIKYTAGTVIKYTKKIFIYNIEHYESTILMFCFSRAYIQS